MRPKSGDLRLASKVASMVCYERLEVGQFCWEMLAGLARSGGTFRFVDGVRVNLGTELGAGLVKVSRWAFVDGTITSRMI